jgi:hypothetical protein
MAPIESKHDVRRKVRDAQAQVNRERLKRESDNREDMVAFLVTEQKLGAVSEWEAERHAQVRLEAEQRRAEQRLEGARALARMRDRGETVADIAQLGSCGVKLVRRYLGVNPHGHGRQVWGERSRIGARSSWLQTLITYRPLHKLVWGLAEAEGLVLQNDSWVAGVGEHSRW